MSQELSLPESIKGIDIVANQFMELGKENPERAYILGNQLAKMGKTIQDTFKE